jgi:hypothetical protein
MKKIALNLIANPAFSTAFSKLTISDQLPAKVAYRVKKLTDVLQKELTRYDEVRQETIKKYSELDKDGNISSENGRVKFKSNEAASEFTAEIDGVLKEEFEIPFVLKFSEIEGMTGLTANDLQFLEPVVDFEETKAPQDA